MRREWWIDNVDFDLNWRKVSVAEFPHKLTTPGTIHVREVLPGDITITRDQLRRALIKQGSYEIDWADLEMELFGQSMSRDEISKEMNKILYPNAEGIVP